MTAQNWRQMTNHMPDNILIASPCCLALGYNIPDAKRSILARCDENIIGVANLNISPQLLREIMMGP